MAITHDASIATPVHATVITAQRMGLMCPGGTTPTAIPASSSDMPAFIHLRVRSAHFLAFWSLYPWTFSSHWVGRSPLSLKSSGNHCLSSSGVAMYRRVQMTDCTANICASPAPTNRNSARSCQRPNGVKDCRTSATSVKLAPASNGAATLPAAWMLSRYPGGPGNVHTSRPVRGVNRRDSEFVGLTMPA